MKQKIDFVVEKAVEADTDAIAEIESLCFSLPWSSYEINKEIAKENVIFLCAKTGSLLIGYISGQMILDEFYISNVAVREEFRNNGVAGSLLDELIGQLRQLDCSFASLEVRASNHTARSLYEKFGFTDLGIRKDFYSHPKEDAHIYTLYFKN